MSARAFLSGAAMLTVAVCLAGCDGAEARFVLHDKTTDLIDDAQGAVTAQLQAAFGKPDEMVAWTRLPVEWGGHAGTVESVMAHGDRHDVLKVRFDAPVEDFAPGRLLQFTSGAWAGEQPQAFRVLDYKPEQGLLVLQNPFDPNYLPQPGDTFVLDFGRTLKRGQTAYMVNCMHCHGVSGDGYGPTAEYLNPRPRDYRLGKFKFKSTGRDAPPRRDDLERIIHDGIPGTYMPSFALMDDAERAAIIEYVRWLSMRGEYEQKLVGELRDAYSEQVIEQSLANQMQRYEQAVAAGQEAERPTRQSVVEELVATVALTTLETLPEAADRLATELAESWSKPELAESVIMPKEPRQITPQSDPEVYAESLRRGRELFDKNCSNCHGPLGHGDGAQTEAYQKIPGSADETYPEPGLYDDWGNPLSPRDLTRGIYRGGRRPIDLYRRVHQGIPGTPMPPFYSKFNDQQIWDLVNYVLSLPYRGEDEPRPTPEPDHPAPVESLNKRTPATAPDEPVDP